jgi:ribonucleotide monophosphatase NagD (HAD superfamily)
MPMFIGKPQPAMVELALDRTGFKKEEAVVIGDRLYTDIACGVNAGISSVFVLSGEGTMDDLEKSEVKPEFVCDNIKQIYEILKD